MRSGGQRAIAAALLAGVVFAWPTYVRYFGLHPGPMVAALLLAESARAFDPVRGEYYSAASH